MVGLVLLKKVLLASKKLGQTCYKTEKHKLPLISWYQMVWVMGWVLLILCLDLPLYLFTFTCIVLLSGKGIIYSPSILVYITCIVWLPEKGLILLYMYFYFIKVLSSESKWFILCCSCAGGWSCCFSAKAFYISSIQAKEACSTKLNQQS